LHSNSPGCILKGRKGKKNKLEEKWGSAFRRGGVLTGKTLFEKSSMVISTP